MILLFVIITIFASLSGVSLTLIPPFLRILIAGDETPGIVDPGSSPISSQGLPLPDGVERARASIKQQFERFMYGGNPSDRLLRFCKVLILLIVVKNLFGYLQTYFTEYLEQKVLYAVRRDIYAHSLVLPLSYFDREKSGHMISKITHDVTMLRGAVIGVAASVLRNVLMTAIAVLIILLVSWKLTLLTLTIIPLNVYFIGIIGRRLKSRSHRAQEGMADMTVALQETVTGIRVVKAFDRGAHEERRFDRFSISHMKQYLKMILWGAMSSPTSEILGTLSFVVILWYGGRQVLAGHISPENLVMFVGAMLFVLTPLKALSQLNNLVQQSTASAQRIFDVLDVPGERREGKTVARFNEKIDFEQVNFSYVDGAPVLRDVTFSARRGDVVAIVGPSGSGKTTLVDLIPRFYEPQSGRVTIDGADTRKMSLESLRALMGIVTQDTILFNDTVHNNIAYGVEANSEEVERAARGANAHEFITAMRHGYKTEVGDRGVQLSGGQRQRLAIARALLRDPEILIFDEATSALDTESELLVQEAIDRLLAGRTTFVIAHRLSTIKHADKILVIEGGHLRERGTHKELLERGGVYKRLYELQFGMMS